VVSAGGSVISADLCMSPCSSDYIFTRACQSLEARRIVSEGSTSLGEATSLLIVRTGRFVTATQRCSDDE
jgi:hypothetical protein